MLGSELMKVIEKHPATLGEPGVKTIVPVFVDGSREV